MFGDPINNPMGWETVTLAECVLRIDSGRSPVCESCARKGNRPGVLKLSAVTQGTFQQGENKAVLQGAPFDPKIEVHAGDLLMTRKNTYDLVGMSAYVFSVNPYLMMSDLIFRLITTDKIDRIFLWKLLNNERFRDNVRSLAGGSAGSMPNISKQRLITLRIPLPSLPAQKEFARFTKQVDKSKFELQQGLEKLNQTYKSLMQEYFRKEPAWKQQQF
jgi:type I restriction enzyme S subunit